MPKCYKNSLVLTLLYRLHEIITIPDLFSVELTKLKEILLRNGYPYFFIENCVKTFFKNKRHPNTVDNNEGYEVMIILPYLGNVTEKIKRKMKKIFQKSLPNCKLKVISKTTFRMANLFSFKDKFSKTIISNIIYK